MIVLISRAPIGRDVPAEVGTKDRMIWRGQSERAALRAAEKYAAGRRTWRAEFFRDEAFYRAPFLVLIKGDY